jgi:hypothetical protein
MVRSLVKSKVFIKTATFVLLLGIAVFAPLLKQQLITGSIVNAVLFISTAYLGITASILIGLLPSLFSSMSGLLPVVLLPMIPYIMISNAILVICFGLLRKRSYIFSVITASLIKFLFLFSVSSYIVTFFIKKPLPASIIIMMGWPQLVTALVGGLLAYIILNKIKNYE